MTVFDSKLGVFQKSRSTKPSIGTLDELQEAFKRLGPSSQREQLENIRDLGCSTGKEKFSDLADLLENVLKPQKRQPRQRTVTRSSGSK